MRSSVIIGCGYVGSSLARFWRLGGHHVAVTTRSAAKRDSLLTIADDVIVGYDWERALKDKDVAVIAVAPDHAGDYENTYVGTARALMPFIKNQQIIYLSSTSVYGDNIDLWVNEETPLNPNSPQGKILVEAEKLYLGCPRGCVLRLGEITGPGRSPVDRLRNLNGSKLPGTGENPINLSPVDMIIQAIDFAAKHKLTGIFNICSDDHRSRKEYYEQICAENNLPLPQWDPTKKSLHGGRRIVVCDKIKKLQQQCAV